MSFIESAFAAQPLHTREEYAATALSEAQAAGFSDVHGAAVCCVMGMLQEAGEDPHDTGKQQIWCPGNNADPCFAGHPNSYPHDSMGNDGRSTGPLQQQMNAPGETPWGWGGNYGDCEGTQARMDMVRSIRMFFTWPGSGLKFKSMDASSAQAANDSIQRVQDSGVPDAYAKWWDEAQALVTAVEQGGVAAPDPAPAPAEPAGEITKVPSSVANQNDPRLAVLAQARPDFNEYPVWVTKNFQSRGETPVDLWLVHTEESSGYDNADGLAHWLETTTGGDNPVSYHYTISKGQNDPGVTVCDVVDTDQACWAVGDSNNRSINLCFAGSTVDWTTAEWDSDLGRCIDVAAYLAVQDAVKYGFDPTRITFGAPNGTGYNLDPPVVSDHRYCTKYLKDGNTHVDVGDDFTVDMLKAAIQHYWAVANSTIQPAPNPNVPAAPNPAPAPAPAPVVVNPADYESFTYDQVAGRWEMFGWRTQNEVLAILLDKALGTNNAGRKGFTRGAPPAGVTVETS